MLAKKRMKIRRPFSILTTLKSQIKKSFAKLLFPFVDFFLLCCVPAGIKSAVVIVPPYCSVNELSRLLACAETSETPIVGFRFSGDNLCNKLRFLVGGLC